MLDETLALFSREKKKEERRGRPLKEEDEEEDHKKRAALQLDEGRLTPSPRCREHPPFFRVTSFLLSFSL